MFDVQMPVESIRKLDSSWRRRRRRRRRKRRRRRRRRRRTSTEEGSDITWQFSRLLN